MTRLPATRRAAKATAATLAVGALTLGATACSGSDGDTQPAASTLVTDAQKVSTGAKSAAIDIVGTVNGTKTTMDIDGALDGSNQEQIQMQGQGRSDGLILGQDAYLKGNTPFWKAIGTPDATAAKLNGKWWKGDSTASSNPAIDVKKLLTDFLASEQGKRLSAKDATVEKTTTNGTDTYTLSDPKASDNTKLVVTRGDDHQIVRIDNYASSVTGNTKASYTFSKWNAVAAFKAPAGAKPISSVK